MTRQPTSRGTAAGPVPRQAVLRALRPTARALLGAWFDVRLSGTDHVPGDGPVVLASNHVGVIDGPLLAAVSPRPVHVLTKQEMFHGALGAFLDAVGQIPLDRFHPDRGALRSCLAALGAGGAVGIFPEGRRCDGELHRFHHGAAWLALASGAPVVPVTLVGTRDPGGGAGSVPRRGTRLDVAFGPAWSVPAGPRPRGQVVAASASLRAHMLDVQARALHRLGRELPGPLPPGEAEADPDTGLTDQPTHPSIQQDTP